MRPVAATLVLALAACHGGAPRPRATSVPVRSPTRPASSPAPPTPRPTGVYVTTAELGSGLLADPPDVHIRTPVLHGLPAAAASRANHELTVAAGDAAYPATDRYLATVFVDGELSVVTDRYVTVDLVVTLRFEPDGTFYDVRPVVIDRATGRRLLFGDLLAPGALPVIAAYATARLPAVLGRRVAPLPARREVLDRLRPRPEGMEVALPGTYVGMPHGDPVAVVVPWPRLARYLRVKPPAG